MSWPTRATCVRWPAESAHRPRVGVRRPAGPSRLLHVDETRVVQLGGDEDVSGRAVSVLGHDEVRLTRARGLLLVEVLAVQQNHHVGVLLDRAGLSKVGELRALVLSLLRATVELADRDDRNLELLRQQLERPAHLGDLLLPALHL